MSTCKGVRVPPAPAHTDAFSTRTLPVLLVLLVLLFATSCAAFEKEGPNREANSCGDSLSPPRICQPNAPLPGKTRSKQV